jgi:hypothetical protein
MFWLGKIIKSKLAVFLIATGACLASCSKSEDPVLKDNLPGFDPVVQKEEVNRMLQIRGSYLENTPLPKSVSDTISAFGQDVLVKAPKVFLRENWLNPASMDTIEIGNEMAVLIPISFTDFPNTNLKPFFVPVNIYFKVTGSTGRWKIPIQLNSGGVVGGGSNNSFSIAVPALVREGNFKVTLCTEFACNFPGYDTLRIFTDTVNALFSVRPPILCGRDSIIGGAGLTIRKIDFGSTEKAGKVKIQFKTYGIADRLHVRVGNRVVVSSCRFGFPNPAISPKCSDLDCWDITYNQWKSYEFDYNPSDGRYAEFLVFGWCGNQLTSWKLFVSCPQ